MTSPATWKAEQREILRAAFAPAFLKYSELVTRIHEPDDWRKYLEFIARQTGLEEPAAKSSAHDGLAMVSINIGAFSRTAAPMTMVVPPPAQHLTPEDVAALPVEDVVEVSAEGGSSGMDNPPYYGPGLAEILAADVIDMDPPAREVAVDFNAALDALGV